MNTNADLILQFLKATGQSGSDITHGLYEIGGSQGMKAGIYKIANYYSAIGMNEGLRRGIAIGNAEGFRCGILGGLLISGVAAGIGLYCYNTSLENSKDKYKRVAYPQSDIDAIQQKIYFAMIRSEKNGSRERTVEMMEDDIC